MTPSCSLPPSRTNTHTRARARAGQGRRRQGVGARPHAAAHRPEAEQVQGRRGRVRGRGELVRPTWSSAMWGLSTKLLPLTPSPPPLAVFLTAKSHTRSHCLVPLAGRARSCCGCRSTRARALATPARPLLARTAAAASALLEGSAARFPLAAQRAAPPPARPPAAGSSCTASAPTLRRARSPTGALRTIAGLR